MEICISFLPWEAKKGLKQFICTILKLTSRPLVQMFHVCQSLKMLVNNKVKLERSQTFVMWRYANTEAGDFRARHETMRQANSRALACSFPSTIPER